MRLLARSCGWAEVILKRLDMLSRVAVLGRAGMESGNPLGACSRVRHTADLRMLA